MRQLIDIICLLNPLDRADTERYIRAHLAYAGGAEEIFTSLALDAIHQESNGIPRLINRICEKCLMYGAPQQKRLIDEHIVKFVAENELIGGAN